ncbi:MAG: hypothetical protein HXX16_04730 [Bacteroidales bacterium]|nr:hypothetical protein [Bacteroidales bacterium]
MKKHVVLILILVSGFAYLTNAQLVSNLYSIYNPISQQRSSSDSTIFSPYGIIKPGKPVYNVTFGAGYTSLGRGMGFSNSSVTPTIAYAPNDKLQIVAGASFSYTNFNNMPAFKNSAVGGNMQQTGGNPTQAFAYGQYQLNNRFSVYAMGSFAKNQLYFSPYSAGIGRADYQQMGVGFNYKLSSRVNIGASVNFASGSGYMGVSPNGFNSFGPMFP